MAGVDGLSPSPAYLWGHGDFAGLCCILCICPGSSRVSALPQCMIREGVAHVQRCCRPRARLCGGGLEGTPGCTRVKMIEKIVVCVRAQVQQLVQAEAKWDRSLACALWKAGLGSAPPHCDIPGTYNQSKYLGAARVLPLRLAADSRIRMLRVAVRSWAWGGFNAARVRGTRGGACEVMKQRAMRAGRPCAVIRERCYAHTVMRTIDGALNKRFIRSGRAARPWNPQQDWACMLLPAMLEMWQALEKCLHLSENLRLHASMCEGEYVSL